MLKRILFGFITLKENEICLLNYSMERTVQSYEEYKLRSLLNLGNSKWKAKVVHFNWPAPFKSNNNYIQKLRRIKIIADEPLLKSHSSLWTG